MGSRGGFWLSETGEGEFPWLAWNDRLEWYILTTSPLCERLVAARIKRKMIEAATFVPIARYAVRRRGNRYDVERVVFPGYLFIAFRDAPPWLYVREVGGVRGVISVDGVPLLIDEHMVGDLMSRCLRGAFNPKPPDRVQRGLRVVASSGPFRGAEGTVTGLLKHGSHADVLMELYGGRDVPARIHVDDLVSVSYSSNRLIG